ncbi:hypothetical protein WM94_18410 [Pseudomonas sp. ABFPK]|nr:hypothetical protein WM94_18410 [Pseudomonas sp. ABFPK]
MHVLFAIGVGVGLGRGIRSLLGMMVSAAWGGLIPGMVIIATHVRMVTCLRCGATLAISSRGIVMARLSGITCSMMVFATAAIAMMARLVVAVLTFMIVHLRFPTTMLMAATGCDECLVLLGIHRRQLVNEGNHAPDVLIAHALAPRRHTRCLDAMLDHPERC